MSPPPVEPIRIAAWCCMPPSVPAIVSEQGHGRSNGDEPPPLVPVEYGIPFDTSTGVAASARFSYLLSSSATFASVSSSSRINTRRSAISDDVATTAAAATTGRRRVKRGGDC